LNTIDTILLGCIKNDTKCQKMLYEKYKGFALKVVFRYIYRYDKAVDITNDGFVKIFLSFNKFEIDCNGNNEKKLMGWIKKIMINTSIDEIRKSNLMPEIGKLPESVWDINDKNDDADQLLLYKDLITIVKELTPQYRMVFNMYVIDGYNHIEIADILKISIGNSKSILSRARAILQNKITKMEEKVCCI
jgi:RNA polymerase sigma factor (sigma-70 family)